MEPLRITLHNAQQGGVQLQRLCEVAKAHLFAGRKLVVELKQATRSSTQNAKFHAICEDVAKSGTKWAGSARTAAEWKVLFVSGHGMATKEGSEMVPGLESEFVNIREATSRMSVARSSSLIEYTLAWCATNGVRLPAYEHDEVAA